MTDDSYELVSAYLDGQATDDEVARIEADPALLREVAEMRAVAAELAEVAPAPDPVRRDAQIAAALDLFDALAAPADETESSATGDDPAPTAPVVDLGHARAKRAEERQERSKPGAKGFPTWLSAAAGLLIIAGGVGWVATQGTGSDDTSETASVAADAESDEESADESTGFRQATEAAPAESAATAPATSTTAPASEATEGEASAPESDDAAADGAEVEEESAEDSDQDATSDTGGTGGLFPEEELERGRVFYNAPPSPEELVDLTEADLFPVELSICGADIEGPTASILVGFVPVSVDGVLGEAFIFESELEARSTVVVDTDCQPLE